MIAGYGKSKHDRISIERRNQSKVICNFLMGFTILQILACDLVFIRIYKLIVKKGERKKNSQHKIDLFLDAYFCNYL